MTREIEKLQKANENLRKEAKESNNKVIEMSMSVNELDIHKKTEERLREEKREIQEEYSQYQMEQESEKQKLMDIIKSLHEDKIKCFEDLQKFQEDLIQAEREISASNDLIEHQKERIQNLENIKLEVFQPEN